MGSPHGLSGWCYISRWSRRQTAKLTQLAEQLIMNAAIVPFRLLIINDSPEEARRLISMFRNAGKPCRAQYIANEDAFHKIIEEQRWDLLIANSDTRSLNPAIAIRSIRQYNLDIPVVLITSEDGNRSVVDGIKLGACDVVKLDDDQHLLLVVERELRNRNGRKATRMAERSLRETERRNQQLLHHSKNGIAFVQDGMFTYANDSFAEICGYHACADIEYIPIMDLVKDEDHHKVKTTLKRFALQNDVGQNNRLSFHVKTAKGHYKSIEAELQLTCYDDETCTQLLLRQDVHTPQGNSLEATKPQPIDSVTGLYDRSYLSQQLSDAIKCTSEEETSYALLCVDIDLFEEKATNVVGIDGADDILSTIAGFLQQHCSDEDIVARLNDHAFAILSQESHIETLLDSGNTLCASIRDHFFEIKNKTIRLTASVGITIINETSIDSQMALNQAYQAIAVIRKKDQHGVGNSTNIYQQEGDNKFTVMVGSLQQAMKEGRFKLLFQPIISLRGDEAERYDVLLRMIDESGNEISPSQFLNTAESMKIVAKIDRWVILEAIKHLSNHNRKTGQARLLVHISHHTLCDESILSWLSVAFKAAKVNPSNLVLQTKEMEISQHLTSAKKFIQQASAMGVNFCISHFGCELDPFVVLDHVDVNEIKIDNSFSLEIQDNPNNTDALEHLITGLKDRQKIITIPMVENANILSKLWKMGIDCIQGNYLQPPSEAMNYEFTVEDTG